jgi:predicted amidohydrolase
MRVAGAQIPVTEDVAANVAHIRRGIDFAAGERAEILLTPEGSLSGYTHTFDRAKAREALEDVTQYARGAGVGLALGTCFEEADGGCYDQLRFYAAGGRYLGFHSKTLTCGTMSQPSEGEISTYAVKRLEAFEFGKAVIGGLVCNDMWANPMCTPMPDPHLSQQLAAMGAKVVFHSVNGGRGEDEWRDMIWQFHEANLRMRAKAGGVWVVTVDSCHPVELKCSAPSGVINPAGEWVCRAAPRGIDYFACDVEA